MLTFVTFDILIFKVMIKFDEVIMVMLPNRSRRCGEDFGLARKILTSTAVKSISVILS